MAETPVPAQAAPETVATAATVEAPVSGENQPVETEQAKPARVFTQEEVDALIGKRLARAKDSWTREQTRQAPEPKPEVAAPAKPIPQSYNSTEEYIEAVAEWKADQRIEAKLSDREKTQREAHNRTAQAQAHAQYAQKETLARVQYPDFDDVVYDPAVPITEAMAFAIHTDDRGPDIAYHLGKHPEEAARIARLSPFLQAKELGRLSAKLPDTPAPTKSAAPEPIPAGKANGLKPVLETTDPRSIKSLANGENVTAWINADTQRQIRNLEARNR